MIIPKGKTNLALWKFPQSLKNNGTQILKIRTSLFYRAPLSPTFGSLKEIILKMVNLGRKMADGKCYDGECYEVASALLQP